MRIQLMSDLHLEFHRDAGKGFIDELSPDGDEVLVLAGDVFSCKPHMQAASTRLVEGFCEKYKDVIFVPGNHEYTGVGLNGTVLFMNELERAFPDFTVLRRDELKVVKGKRFLGDTMWYPDLPGNEKLERRFYDFNYIPDAKAFVYYENASFRKFIQAQCQPNDIVVTHHLPSPLSIATQYIGDRHNCFFLSDMTTEILDKKPALWFHGHTHHQFDYKLGDTRVVANPRGYAGESTQATWNPRLIIEVP